MILNGGDLRSWQVVAPTPKRTLGNPVLTVPGVWLVAKRRAESPRFDMLAGDASLGFGRASHPIQNRALAQALVAAPGAAANR
jgi:hypothetical protein